MDEGGRGPGVPGRAALRGVHRQGRFRGALTGRGVLSEILVPEGETVEVGARLAVIGESVASSPQQAPAAPPTAPSPTPPPPPAAAPPVDVAPPVGLAPPAAPAPPPPPQGFTSAGPGEPPAATAPAGVTSAPSVQPRPGPRWRTPGSSHRSCAACWPTTGSTPAR